MSEATIPLSSLVRPNLSPDWKPSFTSEAMLREQVTAALQEKDWLECPTCKASGDERGAICTQCDGHGWIFDHR
jgi:hypothetical protein